jgi:hypothetical protein
MRLIDANAAKLEDIHCGFGCTTDLWEVEEWLNNQPTVDAVEVVRCKDCKHYKTITCSCSCQCVSADWYCGDGERK